MPWIIALLCGTALLRAADPQFTAAAFYWDATQVAIVTGEASGQVPQNATRMPDRNLRPPWGELFAVPEVRISNGVKIGNNFDINLTGNFWVRATVNSFNYNKTEYQEWMLAIATIDYDNQERYAAASRAKLYIFPGGTRKAPKGIGYRADPQPLREGRPFRIRTRNSRSQSERDHDHEASPGDSERAERGPR